MKKGDTFPVTVQGITVAQAVVEAVESDRVTLLIPGTRAVVGIRVSLTDDSPEPEKETIVDGVHTQPVEESTAPVEPVAPAAPAVEAQVEQQATETAAPVETTPEASVESQPAE